MYYRNQAAKGLFIRGVSLSTCILRGLGQIMLQENAATGLLFAIGVFVGAMPMGLAALIATTCGTITALVLRFDRDEIDRGLYGFNAALVGVAVIVFFEPGVFCWLLVLFGSALVTVIQHFFVKRKIPVFTLPFVLVTWGFVWVGTQYFPSLVVVPPIMETLTFDRLSFAVSGFGQVIFQDNVVSGLLFFIAVFLNSPIAALYGLIAALFSSLFAQFFSLPAIEIGIGLWGYNAVLCAIVFAGVRAKDGIWALLAIFIAFFTQLAVSHYGLLPLTFPFVAGSCATLLLQRKLYWLIGR